MTIQSSLLVVLVIEKQSTVAIKDNDSESEELDILSNQYILNI